MHNLWTKQTSSCLANEHIWHTGSSHVASLRLAKSDGTLAEPAKILPDKASQRLVHDYTWLAVDQDAYFVYRLNDVRADMLRCNSNGRSLYLAWYPCEQTSTKFRTEKNCEEGLSSPCHVQGSSYAMTLHRTISDNP